MDYTPHTDYDLFRLREFLKGSEDIHELDASITIFRDVFKSIPNLRFDSI